MASTMREGVSTVLKKLSGVRAMRDLVEAVAGPRMMHDTRDSWLRRAARNAGSTYRQARALFYGEITDPYHPTVTRFKEAAGRHEAAQLAQRFEGLAQALLVRDEDFHSSDVAALLDAARGLRGLDRSRTDGS